jgi:hypothetical protein
MRPVSGIFLERTTTGTRWWNSVEQRAMYQGSRCSGRFFGRRVNCEQVPLLPAGAVAWVLDDSRKIPYLLVWKSRSDGTVQEAVRITSHNEIERLRGLDWAGAVEIKRPNGTSNFIRTLSRPLPRNGGRVRLLICPYCQTPRRGLYGWERGGRFTTSVVRSMWGCWKCNGLRHASEGGALVHRGRGGIFRMLGAACGPCRSERPEQWYPYVFTSPNGSGCCVANEIHLSGNG